MRAGLGRAGVLLCWGLWGGMAFAAPAETPAATAVAAAPVSSGDSARAPLPATLPFRRDPDTASTAPGLAGSALAVLAVAAALALTWRARKTRMRLPAPATPGWRGWLNVPAADEVIQTLGSRQLSPGVRLHVVQWEGRRYLLAHSAAGVSLLDQQAASTETDRA
ncbi:hypothetical protein SAMN05192549_105182 [Duganella sacchari]|uniref:Flagellar biosynthesis protein, FliO n=1 Tax=Duganella sacchari TaxID=551987 RepID=A0A1M7PL58_9BURK|nr:flagellar biosynthetic protein FliO [Duganella sacchari]SHN17881.1 hypothetical protein SAMN05192549_105182 [Duganella sacchari]